MFAAYSNLCSSSFAYSINYEIQSFVFNFLDQKTENAKCIRIPCIGIWGALNIITAITRIVGIAEVFFKGTFILLLTDQPYHNDKLGLHEIFVHTPKNFLRFISVPLEFIGGTIFILVEPKFFIISMNECMKVNLEHAREDTIGKIEHYDDLASVDGIAYERFLDYQRAIGIRKH